MAVLSFNLFILTGLVLYIVGENNIEIKDLIDKIQALQEHIKEIKKRIPSDVEGK